jgi:hypothetical protein
MTPVNEYRLSKKGETTIAYGGQYSTYLGGEFMEIFLTM